MFSDSIPVLMYHHVTLKNTALSVSQEIFEEQLQALKIKRWKTLSGDEFLYLMNHPKESRKKCIVLTFDDGFVDNYIYAYPILKKYKMKAILFVATDFITDLDIKRKNLITLSHKEMWRLAFTESKFEVMCTWMELREMESEGVFDIQSHGHSHKIPDFMRKADYLAVEDDLTIGIDLLNKHLGKIPLHLSWPKGVYDIKTIDIARKLGFKALYTTQRGANLSDPFFIKRIAIKNKGKSWLNNKLKIYSSSLLTKIYHTIKFR